MKSDKKSPDSFRNLVIILGVLCYTFIHSMSPPVLIVSGQFNYTKPDGIHAIFLPVIIGFSRCIRIYSSAKFEYISREFSPSSKKDMIEPSYKINVEKAAQNLNIKIEWRVRSNMEVQLMQDSRLTICRNVFFQTDSAVQSCCENLDKHKADLFGNINTSMVYKENEIVLDHNMLLKLPTSKMGFAP